MAPRLTQLNWVLLSLAMAGSPMALAETSRQARDDRTVLLYADPVAFSPYFGRGASAGLLLTADTVLEAGVTEGKSCTDENCQFETRLEEARLKLFLGNSFFLNFGIGRERAVWDHGIAWGHTNETNADFTADVTTVGAVFALGNMWQLGGFAIGCDWFGLYVPTSVTEFEFSSGPEYTQASRADDESDAKERAMGTHYLGLRFHLGFSF